MSKTCSVNEQVLMKGQPRALVTHFQNSNFKHKVKGQQIPQKIEYEKFYVYEKILHTRNCRRKFIKTSLYEKRKENMETKQPRVKLRLNYH